MNFKEILSEAIDNNVKIIITGKSGWGKSEMIQQVAQEKGMELIDFRLSEVLPEDIVGVPKVKDDYYEYVPPKWLYEVVNNPDKQYLLFLDEITQGTPEVLNICYKIFDKVTRIGNYTLTNVAVVGATNYSDESNYLSELPEPLKKRACMLELDHNADNATDYLMNKYQIKEDKLRGVIRDVINTSNPRSTDKAIELITHKCKRELVIPYIGYENYKSLSSFVYATAKPEGLTQLDEALYDLAQGYTEYQGTKCKLVDPDILTYKYDLTDEESAIIAKEWSKLGTAPEGSRRNFFTLYAIQNSASLTDDEIMLLSKQSTFNPIHYVTKMSPSPEVFEKQRRSLEKILNMSTDKLIELICQRRMVTFDFMKHYREHLPWDLFKSYYRQGMLTDRKVKEFAKELGL